MAVPKGTRKPRRIKMLKGLIPHAGVPHLDSLNGFVVSCMEGIAFKDHSQIVEFKSKKAYHEVPKTTIYIRALSK
jgi:Holliday junction resolvase RusA-like endonuclease